MDFVDSCGPIPSEAGCARPSPVPWCAPGRQAAIEAGTATLAQLTTLGVGGKVKELVVATTEEQIIDTVRAADAACQPLLVLGGGSNIVASDDPFDGVVLIDNRRGIRVPDESACGGATVSVVAGHPWDDFVCEAISRGWAGAEAMSGIPGSVGAAPVQNIGAYGAEAADILALVTVWDRARSARRMLPLADLKLGYRISVLKRSLTDPNAGGGQTWGPTGRYVVLEVQFQMMHATRSAPVRYGQLANHLGVEIGERVSSAALREAVLDLRRSKGMVLDYSDPDTASAGSFFTNPIMSEETAAALPEEAPKFAVQNHSLLDSVTGTGPQIKGQIRSSAAWLIDHSGIGKSAKAPGSTGRATVSSKHVLALTNRGGATAQEVAELSRYVREHVRATYGVSLVPEPVAVNVAL